MFFFTDAAGAFQDTPRGFVVDLTLNAYRECTDGEDSLGYAPMGNDNAGILRRQYAMAGGDGDALLVDTQEKTNISCHEAAKRLASKEGYVMLRRLP